MELIIKQIKKRGKPVIWIHPITGDYKVPPSDDVPMPQRYKDQGYERKEFTSYFEHKRWMASKGLVCHDTEDVRNDGDILGKNRFGY